MNMQVMHVLQYTLFPLSMKIDRKSCGFIDIFLGEFFTKSFNFPKKNYKRTIKGSKIKFELKLVEKPVNYFLFR